MDFFKAQTSSLIASAMDFLLTILLVEIMQLRYLYATAIGAISGGFCNFFINKKWSFNQGENYERRYSPRYLMVWGLSIALNVFGSDWLYTTFQTSYLFAKINVALLTGFFINYPLQKYYVFKKNQ